MRVISLFVLAAILLIAGCPVVKTNNTGSNQPVTTSGGQKLHIVLARSDLGIADGQSARALDELFNGLAENGAVRYSPLGELPGELNVTPEDFDIGLPDPGSGEPGQMTLTEATRVLDGLTDCDWLVLTSAQLLGPALEKIDADGISVKAILITDNDMYEPVADPAVPVYVFEYDIKHIAFLCGVAAAASANNSMFIALGYEGDPQAAEFLEAAAAGAKYWTNGSGIMMATLDFDQKLGAITPDGFKDAHSKVLEKAGPNFRCNHYILSLGRSTPAILAALTQTREIRAFVAAGYGDYRTADQVRTLGCALKYPDKAMEYVLEAYNGGSGLDSMSRDGIIRIDPAAGATGFTDFEFYHRYHPDANDVEQAVMDTWALLEAGEEDVDRLIKVYGFDQDEVESAESPDEAAGLIN